VKLKFRIEKEILVRLTPDGTGFYYRNKWGFLSWTMKILLGKPIEDLDLLQLDSLTRSDRKSAAGQRKDVVARDPRHVG
jgi:hypothetical protein